MRPPTMFMSSTGTRAGRNRLNFWWLLIKDKGAPALLPVE
jgi:hypothetical protein